MTASPAEVFLYLTTTGRKTGEPRFIEIWFTEFAGCYYMVAEGRETAHWVQNIQHHPEVTFSVGTRTDHGSVLPPSAGTGRIVRPEGDPELHDQVRRLMDARYGWSDGLIVELTIRQASQ